MQAYWRLIFVFVLACAFSFCSAGPVFAQAEGSIRGTVTATADGSRVAGARVLLQDELAAQQQETASDADGEFAFQRIAPGGYLLTISRDGFREERYQLAVRPRDAQFVAVQLRLRSVEDSAQVVAEPYSVTSAHSPGATLLQSDRMNLLSMPQRTNLPEAIVTAAPGMIRGHDDFVHIRGHEVALNPSINGVSFWENPHVVFSPGTGIDYIESMNVMTGGFSAEYGNRFGGILDVVTKSGYRMNNNGSIALGAGTALRHNAALEFGGHSGRAAYYLNLSAFESARFLSPPEPRAIHDTGRGARAFLQLEHTVNSSNFLKLIVMGDGVNFQLPMSARDEALRPDFHNFQRTRSQSLIASWDYLPSARTLVQTAFYQKWSKVLILPNADPFGAKLDSERTLGTFGLRSSVTRFSGRHIVKGGVDLVLLRPDENLFYLSQPWIDFTHLPEVNENHIHFRGPNLGPEFRVLSFSRQKTGGQMSVFLQDKVLLTPNFTADVGVRLDSYHLAISRTHVSPRVNLAYQLSTGTVLHGSYNHFFVPPPVENVLVTSAGLTRFISEIGRALPPLRPITEDQFELGVVHPVLRGVRAGVAGYYRASKDPVHTVLFPDARYYAYANFDRGKAYGLEMKIEAPAIANTGVSGYINYALGRVWFYNPVIAGFVTEAEHITASNRFLAPMDQTHTATSGVAYRNRRTNLWGSLGFEYGSGTPGGHGSGDHEHEGGEADHEHAPVTGGCGTRCPSHFTQNVSLGWDAFTGGDHPRLSLQFNIENISNKVYLISKESTFVQAQYSTPPNVLRFIEAGLLEGPPSTERAPAAVDRMSAYGQTNGSVAVWPTYTRGGMSNVGILIVDGDAAGRAAVQQVLSCEDWRIGAAHDAGQALQELATGNWTLVVANTATIGIDGTLYLTLKELAFAPVEPGKTRLRVLLVVPEEDAANIQPALERDAMPYTLRPFHFHDFLEKVSDLLMETEAIGAPIRRVRQEGKTSGDAYAQRGAQKAGRSTGMFANRDDYSMTEEEIAAYEQEQLFELQRKRKKKPQEHLG